MQREVIVILDNIRSAHNVGSIFRTSDGAGVSKIILHGYTPSPTDRFGRTRQEIQKTSLGASDMIPWEQTQTDEAIAEKITHLKHEGYVVVSIEQTPKSISLYDFSVPKKVVYIVGNEVDGVSAPLLEASDAVVEIPMAGKKESLNVSVAAGIMLYHI